MSILDRIYGKIKYKVRVNYKSSKTQEFWCYNFKVWNGEFSWEPSSDKCKPVILGVDNIESIYQVGYIKPLFVKK